MRKLFILFALLFSFATSFAQQLPIVENGKSVNSFFENFYSHYTFKIPAGDTTIHTGAIDSVGLIVFKKSDRKVYIRDTASGAHLWTSFLMSNQSAGGDVSGFFSNLSVNKILGATIATPSTGNLRYNGSSFVFDGTTYYKASDTASTLATQYYVSTHSSSGLTEVLTHDSTSHGIGFEIDDKDGNPFMIVNPSNRNFVIGDIDDNFNDTYIHLDDVSKIINLNAKKYFQFQDVDSSLSVKLHFQSGSNTPDLYFPNSNTIDTIATLADVRAGLIINDGEGTVWNSANSSVDLGGVFTTNRFIDANYNNFEINNLNSLIFDVPNSGSFNIVDSAQKTDFNIFSSGGIAIFSIVGNGTTPFDGGIQMSSSETQILWETSEFSAGYNDEILFSVPSFASSSSDSSELGFDLIAHDGITFQSASGLYFFKTALPTHVSSADTTRIKPFIVDTVNGQMHLTDWHSYAQAINATGIFNGGSSVGSTGLNAETNYEYSRTSTFDEAIQLGGSIIINSASGNDSLLVQVTYKDPEGNNITINLKAYAATTDYIKNVGTYSLMPVTIINKSGNEFFFRVLNQNTSGTINYDAYTTTTTYGPAIP